MASSRSAGASAWKIFVGVLLALVLLLLAAEFGLRWFMGHQLKQNFAETAQAQGVSVTEEPTVRFGSSPLLFGLVNREIPRMEMHTPSTLRIDGTTISGQPASDVSMEGVSLSQDPVARSMHATTTVPDDFLLASFQKGIAEKSRNATLGNLVVTAIRADDAADNLTVEFAGGLATLALKPTAQDGALAIRAEHASLLGFELPEQATLAISEALKAGMSEQLLGRGMRVEAVDVRDREVALSVRGTDVPLNEVAGAAAS